MLYVLGSAALPVLDVGVVVRAAQGEGWDVCLGLTPTAAEWLGGELAELEALTGHPVKSRYRRPGDPELWPAASAVLVAPATFHTINALALGITGSWVVGFAAEAIGKGIPMAVMPCVNTALLAHPQAGRSLAVLREAGVAVLLGEGGFVPSAPGEGQPAEYPWAAALAGVARLGDGARRG
ncbi:flavoprotein [Kitasatospora sp. NPDC048239]|uniref:flavoprotein n=1 Tax=Kitasatospora sp. NPDC048239 TaxID=3364046 RepID=UPI00371F66EC